MNNVGRTASKNWLSLLLIFLFTFSVSLVGARFVRSILVGRSAAETPDSLAETKEQTPSETALPAAIELQPIIDSWVATLEAEVGVAVYDLDRSEMTASHNLTKIFPTSNLNQFILAYDGYRQIDAGLQDANAAISGETSYGDCLNLMTRTADTVCTTAILADPEQAAHATNFITGLNMSETTDLGQNSTPNDYILFLQHVWQHPDLSLESWAKLQDSLLDQPGSDDGIDWRQGLPHGFSTARVYDKASGELSLDSSWATYADVALVDFVKTDRHFAIVVFSTNLQDTSEISRLGTLIEGKVLEEQY